MLVSGPSVKRFHSLKPLLLLSPTVTRRHAFVNTLVDLYKLLELTKKCNMYNHLSDLKLALTCTFYNCRL